MSKTYELRTVVTELLKEVCNRTYYEEITEKEVFPYQIYSFDGKSGDYPREDNILIIDVWDNSSSYTAAEKLADEVEGKLDMLNYPKSKVLSTFYLLDRKNVRDQDKKLKHVQLKFQVQVYYREE